MVEIKPKKLLFGTAGIPLSTEQRDTIKGIEKVKELGLAAMELEFVHSVNINEKKAPLVNETANRNGIILTCHGQYYINLSSLEKSIIEASKQRILNAAHIANLCGAYSMTFHAGFYMKADPIKVYEIIKQQLKEVINKLNEQNNQIWIRPETTGKATQFGNIKEILKLSEELEHIMPCVDFSHLHARSNGKYNSYIEFSEILSDIEKSLGKEGLNNMHIHTSGIEYGEKGEKNHLILEDSDLNYGELVKAWKDFNIKGVVVCESPNIEDDALLLKKSYESA